MKKKIPHIFSAHGDLINKVISENSNWKNEIRCPYCLDGPIHIWKVIGMPYIYSWKCNNCGERENFLTELNIFHMWEEDKYNE